ncbi:unnamed protein product [Protopolystoma xenopodis]|uniref:PCI domain-containing protein n=1 Tax=Protopolystoma xenopodis TaxID=117903 RepID=A0A448XFH3_9PLAT|nr:unnamed protein product [Protopolystoma xenopodis]
MLARFLRCTDPHMRNNRLANPQPENIVMNHVPPPWDEAISAHLRGIWTLNKEDYEEAYACQAIILTDLKDDNWVLPAVIAVAVDLRRFSQALDIRSEAKHAYGGRMEKTAQLILKLFQICASDSRTQLEDSKKLGMMGLANQLFKIYFQINRLNLCKPMIRALENMDMNEHFSLAQRVTYCYYVGRKAMFDGEFSAANRSLTFAFEHCFPSRRNNKRLILIYLIPVRMLLGTLPNAALLYKYNLKEFLGIVEAVKSGNLKKLNDELERFEPFFINSGVYLMLEKLKSITYRNLFKRV